ncbi:hypothetical protein HPB48_015765 [Haemaphysalis longicornis]|uniref:Transposable element P transposase-like RNase H domain-containing protein n=1 Tax=Haemaphysalis longicornis TaxID=44386 RepID=A0A9J6GII6_HAELO|nr:hypothetical protein HPB48_015765 [Haemaphysalis longicornis]
MTAFKQLKAKPACGMRYNAELILNCMMLRVSSPRAQEDVTFANMKTLPLPFLSRLTQILKGILCKYFNAICLEAIQKQLCEKVCGHKFGSLILYEIKLRRSHDCNASSYKICGFVNYAGLSNKVSNQRAEPALVFVFVRLFESWVQPIAILAIKDAAPGTILAQLVGNSYCGYK